MSENPTPTRWQTLVDNLMTGVTIITAVLAVVLSRVGLIPDSLFPPIIVALLALLATTILIEHRRTLSKLDRGIAKLSETLQLQPRVEVRIFHSAESAIQYLAQRTKAAVVSVEQASIDKQRARRSDARIQYEKAREELILADRVKYRYIGVIDGERRFRAIRKIMTKGKLTNLFAAFYMRAGGAPPLFSFTVFDKEEVVTRAPYELGEDPAYIAIKGAEVAALFVGYFEKLWHSSQKVNCTEDIDAMLASLGNLPTAPETVNMR